MTTDPNLSTQVDWANHTIDVRQSAVSTFVKCRNQYRWEYGEGIEVDYLTTGRPWSNADVGSAFHLCMEHWYLNGDLPVEMILNQYEEEHQLIENKYGKPFDRELVRIMAEGHILDISDYGLHVGETIHDVERQGAATVHDVRGWDVTVHYKVDRLITDDSDDLIVDDLKSVDRFMPLDDYLPQLVRYAMLYRQETGSAADLVRTTQVRRVKRTKDGPFYDRPWVRLTDEMYREAAIKLRAQLTDLVHAIETDGPWYENRTGECSWRCRVEDICKAQVRGDDVGQLVELHYRKKGSA